MKKFLAFLLTVLMIGGMLPTVFAAEEEAEKGVTLVYDFACTALLNSDGTPHGTATVRDRNVKNFKLDRTKSTGYWSYVGQPGVNTAAFQENGLLFFTLNKEEPENSNAMVFTIEIPASGTYSAEVSGHRIYANGEKTDLYIVSKDVVEAKGWDVTTVAGVQTIISEASMTDATAAVKHFASYDTYYQTEVEDELAKNTYLHAGDYYMFAIVNEGTTPTEDNSRTYGMLSKLTLTSEDAAPVDKIVYSFNAEAKSGFTSGSVDMTTMTSYDAINSEESTGAWMYYSKIGMDAQLMYAAKDGGTTFRAVSSTLGSNNNAVILKAKIENPGTYKPSMVYATSSTYGKLNIYFVPVSYADSKWTVKSSSLNLPEVFSDPGVKLVVSQDGWVSSGGALNVPGEYSDVYFDSGEYYVIVSLVQGTGASTHGWATYFKTTGLTLARKPGASLSVSKNTIKVGETVNASISFMNEAGVVIPVNSVKYKSLSPSVATVTDDGVITGINDGEATIQATVDVCGIEYTSSIDISVSRDIKYVFTLGAAGGQKTVDWIRYNNVDAEISAPWRFISKTNIDTGYLYEEGLQFRVLGNNIGNGGYVLKIPVENPGMYIPSVSWTAAAHCSIVDTYIVPVAYANSRWTMSNEMNMAEIVADPGVTLVASVDMSTGVKKAGSPFKFSDDEYYVIILISGLGNGNDSQGRAFGYLKSLELDWVSALSEDVESRYISFATANNVNDNIKVVGNRYIRGDEVEVEAPEIEGYTFRHWVRGADENGGVVSTESSFIYKLITNTYLTAVYTKDSTANTVDFFGGNGEYITTAPVVDGAVEVPSEPKLTGFRFLDWYTAKDKLLSETELVDAVTRAVAVFGDTDDTFTVDGIENLKYDEKITKTYDYPVVWYRDSVRVGYGSTYEYYVWGNVEKITYVEGTAQPLVVLDKTVKDGAYMIEYDAGGKNIVEAGIIFGDGENMTVDSCMYKATSKKNANHGQFTARPADNTYSNARGYIIYEDGSDYKVVYSD